MLGLEPVGLGHLVLELLEGSRALVARLAQLLVEPHHLRLGGHARHQPVVRKLRHAHRRAPPQLLAAACRKLGPEQPDGLERETAARQWLQRRGAGRLRRLARWWRVHMAAGAATLAANAKSSR